MSLLNVTSSCSETCAVTDAGPATVVIIVTAKKTFHISGIWRQLAIDSIDGLS
jgi:hypothetical protein